jgi:glutamyl-tRNA synthetase
MEWDKLWKINKKIADPMCGMHTAVLTVKHVLLTLSNGPDEPFVRSLSRHKKYEGAGKKAATTLANRIWLEYADASDWGCKLVISES